MAWSATPAWLELMASQLPPTGRTGTCGRWSRLTPSHQTGDRRALTLPAAMMHNRIGELATSGATNLRHLRRRLARRTRPPETASQHQRNEPAGSMEPAWTMSGRRRAAPSRTLFRGTPRQAPVSGGPDEPTYDSGRGPRTRRRSNPLPDRITTPRGRPSHSTWPPGFGVLGVPAIRSVG